MNLSKQVVVIFSSYFQVFKPDIKAASPTILHINHSVVMMLYMDLALTGFINTYSLYVCCKLLTLVH